MRMTLFSQQELILRSGYKYELYDSIADDGYITQVTRLINPLADKTKLRHPPLLFEHGGTIDPTAYLLASSIQHTPEPWPRRPTDGPIKSANRSLAFLLANHGFDVFLCESRGSNDLNTRHVKDRAAKSALEGKNEDKNRTQAENMHELSRQWNFWSFTQDDIIAHELKSHIDTVLKVTGADKVSVLTYSLSTPTSFAFYSIRPDYARKTHAFVSMAPIVSGQGTSPLMTLALKRICPLIPETVGTMILSDLLLNQLTRDIAIVLFKPKWLRYTLFKMIENLAMGASPQYRTHIELNLIGHLLRRVSFRVGKQMCQQMASDRLQKYDYGPFKNKELYGTETPPEYDLSNLQLKSWLLVSAWNDAVATPQIVDHLVRIVNPKPVARVVAPYNHVDMIAGFENDKYTNFPIMHYFEHMSYDPEERSSAETTTRSLSIDLRQIFAPLQSLNGNLFVANNQSEYRRAAQARSATEDVIRRLTLGPPFNAMARSFQGGMRTMLERVNSVVKNPRIDLPIQIVERNDS